MYKYMKMYRCIYAINMDRKILGDFAENREKTLFLPGFAPFLNRSFQNVLDNFRVFV